MSITDAIYQGIVDKAKDFEKSIHFRVGDYNPIQIDEQYSYALPPHSPHTMRRSGVNYRLKQYKRIEKDYPTGDTIEAKSMFEKDVEKTAFFLELDSSDLAYVYNLVRTPRRVSASRGKKLAKDTTGDAINYFTKRTFNTNANVGGAIMNATVKDSKPVTRVSAEVYFYERM